MLAWLKQRRAARARLHPEAGVTLVEMMVVIVIIGLITAIVVINVLPAMDRAKVEKARADIAVIEQALAMFNLNHGRYPSMQEGLDALAKPGDAASGAAAPTIQRLPTDPWGRPYQYVIPGEHGGAFDLYSLGRDAQPGGQGVDADIGNWS